MNFIEHVREPARLLLVWQGPEGSSRVRHTVAELLRHPGGSVRLRYLTDVAGARAEGFIGFPAFRKLDQEYEQGVLETFMRRLPPRSRGDYARYLEQFRLRPGAEISDFALLAYTGAKLPGDGFSIIDPLDQVTAPSEVIIEVAGFRHTSQVPLDEITVGSPVQLVAEPDNPHDRNAVVMLTQGRKIGHVPRQQAVGVRRWMDRGTLSAHVERVNGTPERPLVYVFLRFGSDDSSAPDHDHSAATPARPAYAV
ncbi:MAG TPA: HIRAN domain-containing protein [Ottowia sp.]|uniref:HIRAN domain-containing protein n=1 Tax=Ottowia sp. TaxID=1898956 RepID=UPI002BCDC8E9|nr:HIRAN domain-containing protein [Ottowia sp.]HMN20925.1 HIRAN domain-containing protein [Ottowia sp.]